MKRISLFLGLKVVEFGGVFILPYLLGKWNFINMTRTLSEYRLETWLIGWAHIALIMAGIGIIGALCFIIKANWDYAGKKTGERW